MRNRWTSCVSVFLALTMLLAMASLSRATTNYNWVNTSGGSFQIASNWTPAGGPPQSSDAAYFNIGGGNYTVDFTNNASSNTMYLMNDNVTFDMFGYAYNMSSSVTVGWYPGDYGQLKVKCGNLFSSSLNLGFQSTASGVVTLSERTNWNVTNNILVGFQAGAAGYLTVEQGSTINAGSLTVGEFGDSYGWVYVTGYGSSLNASGGMTIGAKSRGAMYIDDDATAHCSASCVGYSNDTSNQTMSPFGEVTVSGSGSQWKIDNDLHVGYRDGGNGTITVNNGADLQCGTAIFGDTPLAQGIVSISGYGSTWTCNGPLQIGNFGYGSFTISDQASVDTNGTTIAAGTGMGVATLTGAGSLWNEAYRLQIGTGGMSSGLLTVSQGSTLNVADTLIVSDNSKLTLDGGTINTHSLEVQNGDIDFPDGTLTVSGGILNAGPSLEVSLDGKLASDLPTFRLVGGAVGVMSCPIKVGETHHGAMEIRGNSRFTTSFGSIGTEVDSVGTVTVSDPGSIWEAGSLLTVGGNGSGELNVLNGAEVWANGIQLAANSGASAEVTVGGTDSQLTTNDRIYVGGTSSNAGGAAVLNIETGGLVGANVLELWNPGTINLNGGTLSVGALMAKGGTLNFNSGTLRLFGVPLGINDLGPLGSSVDLGAGQHIDTSSNNLGVNVDARLCVGSGASVKTTTLNNYGELELDGHTATIQANEIFNAGLLYGSGQIDAALHNVEEGQVRIDSGDWLIVHGASDSFNMGTISMEGSTLEFTETLLNHSSGFISGRGTLRIGNVFHNDGVLALSGGFSDVHGDIANDQPTSRIVVTGGAMATFYDDVHNNGEVRVSAGCVAVFFGEFAGTGGITGTGTVYMEGDLRPGNSPAAVDFDGDLFLSRSTSLEIELAGTGFGQFDSLDVAKLLSLDGTLDVQLIDGFAPVLGDTFDILDWTSLDGTFDSVLLPRLASGLDWNTDSLYTTGVIAVAASTSNIPGDANSDGRVDGSDVTILAGNWQVGVGGGPVASWSMGDFNGDGKVDGSDVTILAGNWQYGVTAAASAVPEPSTILLLLSLIASLMVLRRRVLS